MSFFKTINNTNGSQMSDLDTITLRNTAITSALLPYDTIALRNTAITDMDTITLRNNALIPYDTIALRNTAITSALIPYDTIALRNTAISDMDTVTLRNNALIPYDTIALRNTAIATNNTTILASSNTFTATTNTFSTINATAINLLTTTSQNVKYGFESGLGSLGTNITAIGYQCIKSWPIGSNNTAIGSFISGFSGNNNTLLGYACGSSGNYESSTCIGTGASITKSFQIALGRITETVQIRGGFATSCNSISTTITLANPILSNYICLNGINNIIITLPIPLENGVNLMIRRGVSSTGTININANIFPVNSITSVTTISLLNTTSFVYYENNWYQTSSF